MPAIITNVKKLFDKATTAGVALLLASKDCARREAPGVIFLSRIHKAISLSSLKQS